MLMLFSVYMGLLVGFGGSGYLMQVIGMGRDGMGWEKHPGGRIVF
jgi:hypothetical protein